MISKNSIRNLVLMAASAGLGLACSTAHSGAAVSSSPAPVTASNAAASVSPQPATQSEEDKMPRVNGADSVKLFQEGKALIVDVRSEDSYLLSHAKGSINVPLNKIESGDHKLPKDKRIIAYCT